VLVDAEWWLLGGASGSVLGYISWLRAQAKQNEKAAKNRPRLAARSKAGTLAASSHIATEEDGCPGRRS
jgi:hypothetical protein